MALTDNPYLSLYVRDWLTSNKLKLCSANAHGVLINIMCVLHRENDYGKILLNQKFKQTDKQHTNFALYFAKLLALDFAEIEIGILELLDAEILVIEGDFLIQPRMINDAELSRTRALSGSKGGKKTQKFAKKFAKANNKANTDIEIDIENEIKIDNKKEVLNKKFNAEKFLLENGASEKFIDEWFKIRKAKRLVNTDTAFQRFLDEVKKSKLPINSVLQKCIEKSWGGFDAKWVQDEINQEQPKQEQKYSQEELNRMCLINHPQRGELQKTFSTYLYLQEQSKNAYEFIKFIENDK